MTKQLEMMSTVARRHLQRLTEQDPHFGMVRVAGAVTHCEVGNPFYNIGRHLKMIKRWKRMSVDVGQFGELSIPGYSAGRLHQQTTLIESSKQALIELNKQIKAIDFKGVVIVGIALVIDDSLYNCSVAMCQGKFLAVSVKRFPPNYEEFLELKEFAYGRTLDATTIVLDGQEVPCGTNLILECVDVEKLKIGLPICEDDWTIAASSYYLAANGATVLCSLNGSDELIGKEDFRREQQMAGLASRCIAAYIYTSVGPGESTTDVVFSGHCGIADNGTMLEEIKPLSWVDTIGDPAKLGEDTIVADVDLDHIRYDRLRTNSFGEAAAELRKERPCRKIRFTLGRSSEPRTLMRKVDAHPYVPVSPEAFDKACRKMRKIKLAADVTRVMRVGTKEIWLALSGGSDSMARLADAVAVSDNLGWPRSAIKCITMPGFGTQKKTKDIVIDVCRELGVTLYDYDIRAVAFTIMKTINHKPFGIDLANKTLKQFQKELTALSARQEKLDDTMFENVQAHVRTLIVTRMGFAFGTGDMSELLIGWCTFLADQLGGHYNTNATLPKTLVKEQIRWIAENDGNAKVRELYQRCYDLIVTPELLPIGPNGELRQKTDETNGPEEVRDFFLRYFRRFGDTPEKILYLALHAVGWKQAYTVEELIAWWQRFAKRVFQQRFKNATRVDGAQVGGDSLSPHGNWVIPSDANPEEWLLAQGFDINRFLPSIRKAVLASEQRPA